MVDQALSQLLYVSSILANFAYVKVIYRPLLTSSSLLVRRFVFRIVALKSGPLLNFGINEKSFSLGFVGKL